MWGRSVDQMSEHFDVVVVGAGISGISAAYHLQTMCPDRTFTILDGRDDCGFTAETRGLEPLDASLDFISVIAGLDAAIDE